MAKVTLERPAAFKGLVGKELGASDWVEVTQDQIEKFADATGDHQWIHVDVERAKRESPFGGPIAHGYLTLSLLSDLVGQIVSVGNVKLVVNYGLNKVRFPSPVPSGSRVRAVASVASVKDIGENSVEAELSVAVNVEGVDKPSLVAAVVYRYYGA